METRSLTYVYDNNGKVIVKMYLGYPSRHGLDLAKFLKSYAKDPHNYSNEVILDNKYIEMEKLADNLVSHFFYTKGEYVMLISPFCSYYCCQDYEYHIYPDKVRIVTYEEEECDECDVDWKTEDFEKICVLIS
jgi:hypothetical protein